MLWGERIDSSTPSALAPNREVGLLMLLICQKEEINGAIYGEIIMLKTNYRNEYASNPAFVARGEWMRCQKGQGQNETKQGLNGLILKSGLENGAGDIKHSLGSWIKGMQMVKGIYVFILIQENKFCSTSFLSLTRWWTCRSVRSAALTFILTSPATSKVGNKNKSIASLPVRVLLNYWCKLVASRCWPEVPWCANSHKMRHWKNSKKKKNQN